MDHTQIITARPTELPSTTEATLFSTTVLNSETKRDNKNPTCARTTKLSQILPEQILIIKDNAPKPDPICTAPKNFRTPQTPEDHQFLAHVKAILHRIDGAGHTPLRRGIHQKQAIDFYETFLGANPETVSMLRNGYTPVWDKLPEPQELRNNRSSLQQPEFCRKQVKADFVTKKVIIGDLERPRRSDLILWEICVFIMLALMKIVRKKLVHQ